MIGTTAGAVPVISGRRSGAFHVFRHMLEGLCDVFSSSVGRKCAETICDIFFGLGFGDKNRRSGRSGAKYGCGFTGSGGFRGGIGASPKFYPWLDDHGF